MSDFEDEAPPAKKQKICSSCEKYYHKMSNQRRKTIENVEDLTRVNEIKTSKNPIALGDQICNTCRLKLTTVASTKSEPVELNLDEPMDYENSPLTSSLSPNDSEKSGSDPTFLVEEKFMENFKESNKIEMNLMRVISTHSYCMICGYDKKTNLVVVPFNARKQVFVRRQLFIPSGNRCCKDHIIKSKFFENLIEQMEVYSSKSVIEVSDLTNLLKDLSVTADQTLLNNIAEFNIPEKQIIMFTGLKWENLIELREKLVSMEKSPCRTITQALIVLLFKLRSAQSHEMIASVLGVDSKQRVSDMIHQVLSSFEKDILSKEFGLQNVSREDLINNQTSSIAKKLFNLSDTLIIICDGTYIRHQKSSNNEYQRLSYSGQKKVPLCKPFTIATTNGFIVDMLGPYPANKNDAEILKMILKESDSLKKLSEPKAIYVLDRGFRDVKNELEQSGISVLMPALKGKRAQLTSAEANESRFVTKLRWSVEAVHGI